MCAGVLIHEPFFSNLRAVRWTYLSAAQLSQIARAHVQQGDAASGGQLGELERSTGWCCQPAGLLRQQLCPLNFTLLCFRKEGAHRGRGRTMMEMCSRWEARAYLVTRLPLPTGPCPCTLSSCPLPPRTPIQTNVHDTCSHVLLCKATLHAAYLFAPLTPPALLSRHVTAFENGSDCETSWQLWIKRRRRTCTKPDHLQASSLMGGDRWEETDSLPHTLAKGIQECKGPRRDKRPCT
jgi:hypothetical protein